MSEMKTKVCKVCGEEKLISEFYTVGKKKDGTYNYKTKCKICTWKELNKPIFDDVLTENILNVILDSILNDKIDSLNELQTILNISLEEIINIVKILKIKNKFIRVEFQCSVCGKKFKRTLSQIKNKKTLYCSKECHIKDQNHYDYSQGYSKCNKCGEIKSLEEFLIQKRHGEDTYLTCKVCGYFERHKNLIIAEGWTKEEYIIILDNLLNKNVDCVNDILPYLYNKNIDDIAKLLNNELNFGGKVNVKFRKYCMYCDKEIKIKLYQFLDDQLHFCSYKCNSKYYGEIKSENTPKYKRICQYCGKEFYVRTSRVKFEKDKYCSPECSQKHNRIKFKGENNPNWQGGISQLYNYLRRSLLQWKNDSMSNCKYKCVLSNEKFHVIHHLYAFENIIQDTLLETNLELKSDISYYTQEELLLLSDKCLEIHYRHPLGVCLKENIHKLFHDLYGYGNNTPEQFEEFKRRYDIGEFNNILKRKIS